MLLSKAQLDAYREDYADYDAPEGEDVRALLAHIDDQQKLIDRLVGMLEAVLDINTPAAAGISHHAIRTVDGTASVTYKCIPPGCRVCEIDRQARALLEEVGRGQKASPPMGWGESQRSLRVAVHPPGPRSR